MWVIVYEFKEEESTMFSYDTCSRFSFLLNDVTLSHSKNLGFTDKLPLSFNLLLDCNGHCSKLQGVLHEVSYGCQKICLGKPG